MKIILFIVFLSTILCLKNEYQNLNYHVDNSYNVVYDDSQQVIDFYQGYFKNRNTISQQEFIQILSQFIKQSKYEKLEEFEDIREEIAHDLAIKNNLSQYRIDNINQIFQNNYLRKFINEWNNNMIAFLIKKFKIQYDQEFLQELYSNPDFYGLNYDSYKIMTFKFKNKYE